MDRWRWRKEGSAKEVMEKVVILPLLRRWTLVGHVIELAWV